MSFGCTIYERKRNSSRGVIHDKKRTIRPSEVSSQISLNLFLGPSASAWSPLSRSRSFRFPSNCVAMRSGHFVKQHHWIIELPNQPVDSAGIAKWISMLKQSPPTSDIWLSLTVKPEAWAKKDMRFIDVGARQAQENAIRWWGGYEVLRLCQLRMPNQCSGTATD